MLGWHLGELSWGEMPRQLCEGEMSGRFWEQSSEANFSREKCPGELSEGKCPGLGEFSREVIFHRGLFGLYVQILMQDYMYGVGLPLYTSA